MIRFVEDKIRKMEVKVNEIHQRLTGEFLSGKFHKPMRCPNCNYMQSWMIDPYLDDVADSKALTISLSVAVILLVAFLGLGFYFRVDTFFLVLGATLTSLLVSLTIYLVTKSQIKKKTTHPNAEYLSKNSVPTRINQPKLRLME
jgi:hypothetical protein